MGNQLFRRDFTCAFCETSLFAFWGAVRCFVSHVSTRGGLNPGSTRLVGEYCGRCDLVISRCLRRGRLCACVCVCLFQGSPCWGTPKEIHHVLCVCVCVWVCVCVFLFFLFFLGGRVPYSKRCRLGASEPLRPCLNAVSRNWYVAPSRRSRGILLMGRRSVARPHTSRVQGGCPSLNMWSIAS